MYGKAIVVGGGIGGLATAVALQQIGWRVEVYERAPELHEVGSGLSLWNNALIALDRLGLLQKAKALGISGQKGAFVTPEGRQLLEMKLLDHDSTAAEGVILLLHRAELQQLLFSGVEPGTVHTGARCIGVSQDDKKVTAYFEDGREAAGDLLVGADGLRSVVREELFGAQPPQYGGYTTWRAITTFDPARLRPGETWGLGKRFGQWGMTQGRAYWYATLTVPAGQGDPLAGRKQGLLDLFRGWHAPVEELIARTEESVILRNDVFDRPPLPTWSQGRATLLGDAAHPMTPDMGQGGCQALEDAVVLGRCLRDASDLPAALKAYEQVRIPRTSRVVRESRNAGWIAQWSNPLACRFRAALLRSRYVARKQAEQLSWMIAANV